MVAFVILVLLVMLATVSFFLGFCFGDGHGWNARGTHYHANEKSKISSQDLG